MKKTILLAFFVFILKIQLEAGGVESNEWGEATNGLQMKIATIKTNGKIEVNSDFTLLVSIRNSSTNSTFGSYISGKANTDLYNGIGVEVISPWGFNKSPDVPEESPAGASETIFCMAGQTNRFRFKLGQICRLKSTGTYRIVAKKLFFQDGKFPVVVVSNPLFVDAVPVQRAQ